MKIHKNPIQTKHSDIIINGILSEVNVMYRGDSIVFYSQRYRAHGSIAWENHWLPKEEFLSLYPEASFVFNEET